MNKNFFIFDVESIGLYGEGFAVAGVVYSHDFRNLLHEFAFHCDSDNADGTDDDRRWIKEHVTISNKSTQLSNPSYVRGAFSRVWEKFSGNSLMFVECGYPVETNFLSQCVIDEFLKDGPYPVHEISTVMACAGINPMLSWERLPHELPAHEPLGDSMLSARILMTSLQLLKSDVLSVKL